MAEDKSINIIQFNNDCRVLQLIADEKVEQGDFEGALDNYLKIEGKGKFSVALYRKIANIYTELKMYNESIEYWFKYLNSVSKRHYAEAYNGIAGNYYLLGYNEVAAYYFNLQINDKNDCDLPFDDYMYELFYSSKENASSIKLVDKQGEDDQQTLEKAKKEFDKNPISCYAMVENIKSDSSRYSEAIITLAAFDMVSENYESASKRYLSLLNDENWGGYAYNNLFGCIFCLKDYDWGRKFYKKLVESENADYSQLAKFFQIFKSDENYIGAYEFACYFDELFNNPNSAFLYACACFNVEKYQQAKVGFLRYSKAVKMYFPLYYLDLCEKAINGQFNKKIDYVFALPQSSEKLLEKEALVYSDMNNKQVKKNSDAILQFCFNCFSINNIQLQGLACQLLSLMHSTKSDKYLKNLLINPMIDDKIKMLIVTLLVKDGNDKLTGMLYGNVYTRIPFEKVEFNEENGDIFLDAYSIAFGLLAPYDETQLYKLKTSAYEIYYKLVSNGNVRKVNDVTALSALIVVNSNIKISRSAAEIIGYIGSSIDDVKKIKLLIDKD